MSSKRTIIVESPTKAKTLSSFLKGVRVVSCRGHVRDLPEKKMGVDVENDFQPDYCIPESKKKIVKELQGILKTPSEVYLATDPDREGEAIAWHLVQTLRLKAPKRIVFHEITRAAVEKALETPRSLDENLIEAQQARRILDRLVGFSISPLLWKKVRGAGRRLSAGRVQSVALRLLVEREREIQVFQPKESWSVHAFFEREGIAWEATLKKRGTKEAALPDEKSAQQILQELKNKTFLVKRIEKKVKRKAPPEPYRTSTLQQDANRKLGFSASRTMVTAQHLYEGITLEGESAGLITYMRTDSVRISEEAKRQGEEKIRRDFGKEFLSPKPQQHKKVRGAQEAHEAIRPTRLDLSPEKLKAHLQKAEWQLYDLIYRRFLASLMREAEDEQTRVFLQCGDCLFQANGLKHLFPGFRVIFSDESKEQTLPSLKEGEALTPVRLEKQQHFTQPPPRYTEASLVKTLEEKGIGRPSTYAPTLETLKRRNYCSLEKRSLVPTELGCTICDLLTQHFPDILDIAFTATMESELDRVEEGGKKRLELLREFYAPFAKKLREAQETMESVKVAPEKTDLSCKECGGKMVVRTGRYGKFLSCENFPTCKSKRPFGVTGVPCPDPNCDGELIQRRSRRGPFYGCSRYPECKQALRKLPDETAARSS